MLIRTFAVSDISCVPFEYDLLEVGTQEKQFSMADTATSIKREDSQIPKRKINKFDSNHVLRKRLPPRVCRRNNDIYITNKTNFQSQIGRCEKLLDSGETEIIIHGLGAAVPRAVNLALRLQEKYIEAVKVAVNTSTVDIVDDLEAVVDEAEPGTQVRQNSSVHIRVYRSAPQL